MNLTKLFTDFFDSEKTGGLILVFVTALSLVLANSAWQTDYINFWHFDLGGHSIVHWINDGLMTIFFLLNIHHQTRSFCKLFKEWGLFSAMFTTMFYWVKLKITAISWLLLNFLNLVRNMGIFDYFTKPHRLHRHRLRH